MHACYYIYEVFRKILPPAPLREERPPPALRASQHAYGAWCAVLCCVQRAPPPIGSPALCTACPTSDTRYPIHTHACMRLMKDTAVGLSHIPSIQQILAWYSSTICFFRRMNAVLYFVGVMLFFCRGCFCVAAPKLSLAPTHAVLLL